MRYFIDSEFIEDGITIDLISLGVVAEDGRELYREVHESQVPWHHANPWVVENVKPHLVQSGAESPFDVTEVARTRAEIAHDLLMFVAGPTPEFWGYYADYDWVVIAQLFGTMMDLPEHWPMFCMDLKQLAVSIGDPELPEQTSTEHHALVDARWNRDVYAFLSKREADPAGCGNEAEVECPSCSGSGDCGFCDGDGCGAHGVPSGDPSAPHCADGTCTRCKGTGLLAEREVGS